MSILDLLALWVALSLVDIVVWALWRSFNAVSDMILRKRGWDAHDEWIPMTDYIPAWRLIRGVKDMPPKEPFRRRI